MKPESSSGTGRDAAVLSVVEMGLGSLLHAFHVPLSGHFLSLNQGFLLSRAVRRAKGRSGDRLAPFSISTVASVLKSLSPAGKKLTPMLAISAQGSLFGLGTLCLGANAAGAVVGSLLASLWAFLQPLLLYWLFFGQTLIEVGHYYLEKTREAFPFQPELLLQVLLALVVLKAALAAGLALGAFWIPERFLKRYEDRMIQLASPRLRARSGREPRTSSDSRWQAAALAARDLLNPLFLASLFLTAFFFYFAEMGPARAIWELLRPVAVAFVFFWIMRTEFFSNCLSRLDATRFRNTSQSVRAALHTIELIEYKLLNVDAERSTLENRNAGSA